MDAAQQVPARKPTSLWTLVQRPSRYATCLSYLLGKSVRARLVPWTAVDCCGIPVKDSQRHHPCRGWAWDGQVPGQHHKGIRERKGVALAESSRCSLLSQL